MGYKIKCWIPVPTDDQEVIETLAEAFDKCDHLQSLQPENIYSVVNRDDNEIINLEIKSLNTNPKNLSQKDAD